jgi:hypothetical protein
MPECDGSCFSNPLYREEIRCQDGEVLVFYFCSHELIWILVTYLPPLMTRQPQ